MTTITRIARRAFTEMLRDGRFRTLATILFTLLLTTLLIGWRQYAEQSKQRAEAQHKQREQWLKMVSMPPHLAAHTGTMVFKQSLPLTALERGIDSYAGVAVFLEAHRRNLFDHKPAEESPIRQRFGELTVALTMQLLLPLFIILLGFPAFAGEREAGTLRQLLSLGVSRRALALGKALGVAGPLLLLLAPAALLGVAALALFDQTSTLLASGLRLAWLIIAYFSYFTIFLCLSLIVSAHSANAQRALLALLGIWFVVCLMLPRGAMELAQRIYPIPAARDFTAELDQDKKGLLTFEQRRQQVQARLLKQYGLADPKQLTVSPYGQTLYEAENEETEIYEQHFARLFASYEQQNRFYQMAAFVTPLTAVQSLSMGLAGSDWRHHRHYADAAEAYRRVLVQTMNRGIAEQGAEGQYKYQGRELYERVPVFGYQTPDVGWALSELKPALFLLSLWLVALLLITPLALLRLRVN
jgi:ABC-2 type transport system permease protein